MTAYEPLKKKKNYMKVLKKDLYIGFQRSRNRCFSGRRISPNLSKGKIILAFSGISEKIIKN